MEPAAPRTPHGWLPVRVRAVTQAGSAGEVPPPDTAGDAVVDWPGCAAVVLGPPVLVLVAALHADSAATRASPGASLQKNPGVMRARFTSRVNYLTSLGCLRL